jgi:hypothetical protein
MPFDNGATQIIKLLPTVQAGVALVIMVAVRMHAFLDLLRPAVRTMEAVPA